MEIYMEKIHQYIDSHKEDMALFWKTIVNMQGASKEPEKKQGYCC